ncbi:MAG: hypothetical protein IJD22_00720 [Clostridia bacterium]|nr:hypothetical protein [Clostridia bacterium]
MNNKMKHCKTCGSEISKNAGACPRCGAKNKSSGCLTKVILFAVIAILAIIVLALVFGNEPAEAPEVPDYSDYYDSIMANTDSSDEPETEAPVTDAPVTDNSSDDAVDPAFKATMDSYEKFFKNYLDFLNQYEDNPADLSLISKYTDYMNQYIDTLSKLEAIDESTLGTAELAYYTEAMVRINAMLVNIGNIE